MTDPYPQAEGAPEPAKPNIDVFVTGFGMDGREEDVRKIFEEFGPIEQITIRKKPMNPQAPPYAFIKFVELKDAEASLVKNNTHYGSNVLKVEFAKRDRGYSKEEALPPPRRQRYQDRNHGFDRDRERRYDDRSRYNERPRYDNQRYDDRDRDRYSERDRYDDRERYSERERYDDRDRYASRPRYDDRDRGLPRSKYDEPRRDYEDRSPVQSRRYDMIPPPSPPYESYDDRRRSDPYYDRRDYGERREKY
ncbi:hypothetical protein TVAG_147690 [Trichomonas vaginalis G3]|uniref:RRM domain-containing protein n=1 Tax=Trichomonas vaginalis (strain ATCC PRA-98 / G3) TaxID=412133 RepID=A2G826_TRIV3|nr:eukaryotic translation initiation factor 3 subunit G family [Trichomonas vaginalis G3]EAX86692.1 hypothetical protein TVAG_147690 [Trichomonas vaginalis G3]KAI5500814.1 eukaryotic translation initiation factor 3 subunit G family [Trichomonas vaginalis G3]|eukprot:XP_001299622.1 hypothetical protein [Trichomonas vaginalis G3]